MVRRSVQCDGVRGVLARRDGRWTVDNESEIRMLAALGRDSPGAIDRFKALAETLNADLVDVGSLRWLNGRLSELVAATPDEVPTEWGDPQVMAQVAFACACMSDPSNSNGAQWLAWALSARLQNNLVDGPLPGSGWLSMRHPDRYWSRRFDRDTCWTTMMPAEFWGPAANPPRAVATGRDRGERSSRRCDAAQATGTLRPWGRAGLGGVTPQHAARSFAPHLEEPAQCRIGPGLCRIADVTHRPEPANAAAAPSTARPKPSRSGQGLP